MLRVILSVIAVLGLISPAGQILSQETGAPLSDYDTAPSHQPDFPLWAYGHITPPDPPEDWSEKCLGTRPRDCDRPRRHAARYLRHSDVC